MNADARQLSILAAMALVLGGAFCLFAVACAVPGCQPSAQAPSDVVTLTSEATELQGCIDDAKAHDAGLSYYEGCADSVKRRYHDGGEQ